MGQVAPHTLVDFHRPRFEPWRFASTSRRLTRDFNRLLELSIRRVRCRKGVEDDRVISTHERRSASCERNRLGAVANARLGCR